MASSTVFDLVLFSLLLTLPGVVESDDCPEMCSCISAKKGGQKVLCSSKGIQNLRIDKLPQSAVEIILSHNQINIIKKDSFPVSRRVRKLDLRGNHIRHIEPGAFQRLPKLTHIYLQVNQLVKIDKETFQGLRNLRRLNISQNQLLYIHTDAFADIKNLRKISLKKNKLTTLQMNTFSNTSKIELDHNELICDCDMLWLVQITRANKGVVDGSKCAHPKELAGKKIRYLASKKWNCRTSKFQLPKFKTSPVGNQIVFQNDSLELSCSSVWQPRGELVWVVEPEASRGISVKHYSDMYARENKSVLSINRIGSHHSGLYVCRALMNNLDQLKRSVSISVIGWETKFCPLENKSSKKGNFVWHTTAAGGYANQACPYGKGAVAWRNCSSTGVWEEEDVSKCQYVNLLTRKLDFLRRTNLTARSIRPVVNDLLNITHVYQKKFSDVTQLRIVAEIFSYICATKFPVSSYSAELVKKYVSSTLTNILRIYSPTLEADQSRAVVTHRLLSSLENYLKQTLDREIRHTSKDVPVTLPVTTKIAGYTRSYRPAHPHSLLCSVLFREEPDPTTSGYGGCGKAVNGSNVLEGLDAQLLLPKMLFALSSGAVFGKSGKLTNVTFISYKTAEIFPPLQLHDKEPDKAKSSINSVIIGVHVQVPGIGSANLVSNENVVITFKHSRVGSNPRLVYWSPNKTPGSASTWALSKKCKLITEDDNQSKFMCSELPGRMTYFALIMDIPEEGNSLKTFRLEIVTYFGAGFCSMFLLMTLATFAFFRELRYNRNDAATLMNLCLALIVAVIIFVFGVTRVDNQLLCKAFAVLLHYFLLCGLLWLGCGGACLTSLIKKGPDNEEYNPVLKYYLISWGLPMIVCGITLAGNSKNYNSVNYCWLTSRASIGAFIVPGGLIVVTNMIVFLRLHALINRRFPESSENKRLENSTKNRSSKATVDTKPDFRFPDRNQLLDFIKGSLTVMLILCIDCGFVVMIFINKNSSSRYLYYTFSYGFALANFLLGLSVFVFHCVRREDVYHCWKSFLLRRTTRLTIQEPNETEGLIDQTDNAGRLVSATRPRTSASHSEHNREHSDVISAFSAVHSVFTHDLQSSRPSSVFGQSCAPAAAADKPYGQGRLTLPTFDKKASDKSNNESTTEPTAPPLPPDSNLLAGFAAYPPSTVPENVTVFNEQPGPSVIEPTQNTRVTAAHTSSEKTYSEKSHAAETKVIAKRQSDSMHQNVMSDCSSVPSHMDSTAGKAAGGQSIPLRSFVAPNWKPVRRGGSTAVFYPYVDPGYKMLQGVAQNSCDSVVPPVSMQGQTVVRPEPLHPLVPAGAFTIPQRSDAMGGSNSNKTHSAGNQTDHQTDQDQLIRNPPEIPEAKVDEKPTEVKKSKPAPRRRRRKSRTKFEDIPVEKCLVYVPLPRISPKKPEIRNETSV